MVYTLALNEALFRALFMPWKETKTMDQRTKFAQEAMHTDNLLALCKEYGISRPTGYKWIARYKALGASGMNDLSRAPKRNKNALSEDAVCEIVFLKKAHPKWGPAKIRELYRRKHKGRELPSESSFKRVLNKSGLTKKRRRRIVSNSSRLNSGAVATKANDIWTIDFKGWWRDCNGLKVEPFTVRDEYSRKILDVRLLKSSKTEAVQACFEILFKRYGLPRMIRSDNGSPFASSRGLLGLSRLSAWWLALGISLERGRPGCPQDNGAHERMHLDIYRELQCEGVGFDQPAFDLWRKEYNEVRPHSSLGMLTPDEVYSRSEVKYVGTPAELGYPSMDQRKVHRRHGSIRLDNELYMLSSSLGGWHVGIKYASKKMSEIWFSHLLIGHIDHAQRVFIPIAENLRVTGKSKKTV